MTIEKPNHIEKQSFRSVREAGYAEEDVDVYVSAITESYNRLLDAHYEAQVRAETEIARAADLETRLNSATTQLSIANGQVQELNQTNSALSSELATTSSKLEFAVKEIENLRKDNEDALANVNSLMGQVNAQTAASAAERVSIDEAADQAASLLRRAEEIAAEHISNAERQAEGIVGKAKQEISFLESSINDLKEEKDAILSRLHDFFAYEVRHVEEMIDRYNSPETIQADLEKLNAYSPADTPAYEEAEDAYYEDKAEELIADQQHGQEVQQQVQYEQYEQPVYDLQQPVEPVYQVDPVQTAAYETEPRVEYIEPVEQQISPAVEEDYAPPVSEQASVESYAPPVADQQFYEQPVASESTPQQFENFSPENFPPVPGTAGETEVPAVTQPKKKRSFRELIRGENN